MSHSTLRPEVKEPRRLESARRRAWRQQFLEKQPIDVSVCIANWNCRDLLRACLESLHDQPQGVTMETIVVDNASSDGAAEMVAEEFPEVVLIRNEQNRGFAIANNQAAAKARGRNLFFLNNGTFVPRGTLAQLCDYLESHPEVGMVGPRLRDGRGEFQVSYRLQPTLGILLHRTMLLRWTGLFKQLYRRYRRQGFDPNTTRAVDVLMGAAMLLSRDTFAKAGGWDEGYEFGGEDLDISTAVNRHAPVVYHPAVEIIHYGRVSTRQHIGFASSKMANGFVRYLRRTGSTPLQVLLYKLVVTLDAPLQIVGKTSQWLWRRWWGRKEEAEKSRLALKGLVYFLAWGLPSFWRA